MACKSLDEQVARRDREIAGLLEQFVCVRMVQANAMDLTLFQFDQDLTWAVFFLNADRTIYGRYGTRSQHDGSSDISMEGFAKAMQGALQTHKGYPANQGSLKGNIGAAPKIKSPEGYPSLKKYPAVLPAGAEARKNCMHCHQIVDARRLVSRNARQPIPDEELWRYPLPQWLGLEMDPREKARVARVVAGSAAAKAGFQKADDILTLQNQVLHSLADLQWVLENAGKATNLSALVQRAGQKLELKMPLQEGWRRQGDFSWRTSSWDLRRMAAGGMVCEDLTSVQRAKVGLEDNALALRVKYLGMFGEHRTALNAGFKKDDILVAVDGLSQRMSESVFLAYGVQKKMPGDRIDITVLRAGKRMSIPLKIQ